MPYWASIAAGEAMMRTGPDRSYPATWVYRRKDLPIRVLQIEGAWRRVQERDGTTGWMLATLLAKRRTALIVGETRPILDGPDGKLLWRAEPGVVGRISDCDGRWCKIEIGEKRGYIAQDAIWGTGRGEVVE